MRGNMRLSINPMRMALTFASTLALALMLPDFAVPGPSAVRLRV